MITTNMVGRVGCYDAFKYWVIQIEHLSDIIQDDHTTLNKIDIGDVDTGIANIMIPVGNEAPHQTKDTLILQGAHVLAVKQHRPIIGLEKSPTVFWLTTYGESGEPG